MVNFTTNIEKFSNNGEKTGWTYVLVPSNIAQKIKSEARKSIRVMGKIDELSIKGMSLLPIGAGDFILALNASVRKKLRKEVGAQLNLSLAYDADFKIEIPEDLEVCLAQEDGLLEQFLSYTKGHQNYFINWLNTAKTEPTRTKRLVMIVNAMANKQDFGLMIRSNRGR
jgi:N-acetylglucosamine kinase-like BadF-type ATPase